MVKKFSIMLFILLCLISALAACGNSKAQQNKDIDTQQTKPSIEKTENAKSDLQETQETEASQIEQTIEENELDAKNDQIIEKTTLVVYFSATGTTKKIAEKIASITDADIYEIVPTEIYSSEDLDYGDSNSRSSVEMNDPNARPEIGSETISLEGYSTIYLGYPIWWGEAPRIMSTFVESYDFSGITIIPFCTSGSSDIGKSKDNLASQAGKGTWLSGKRIDGNVSESDLMKWIETLQ